MTSSIAAPITDTEPFSERQVVTTTIVAANTNTQVAEIPWPNPTAGRGVLLRLYLSNSQATAAVVVLWDQDLNSATPIARGSAAAPLYRFNVPANSDVNIGILTLPREYFQAGICAQSTQVNMFAKVEYVCTIN